MDFIYCLGLAFLIYHIVLLLSSVFLDSDMAMIYAERFGKPVDVLKGKIIWITGASSGIGEGTAVACAKGGAKLILTARRKEELERVKRACIKISEGKLNDSDVLVLPLDLLDTESHQKSFERVMDHFGRLDILVNNAGRTQRANWEDIEPKVDKDIFDLNVFSLIHLTRICVRYFIKSGVSGHVAVTSSTAGLLGVPFSSSYTGAKHAVHGYFNSLRIEKSANNLAITIFCPGPTFTGYLQDSFTDKADVVLGESVQPTDRRMTSERCGYLFAVALANKIDEAWVSIFPLISVYYLISYFPNLFKIAQKIIKPSTFQKMRDSRESVKTK